MVHPGFNISALLGIILLLSSHRVNPIAISSYHAGLELPIYLVYLKLTFVKPELSFQGNPLANFDHFDTLRNQCRGRVFLYAKDHKTS